MASRSKQHYPLEQFLADAPTKYNKYDDEVWKQIKDRPYHLVSNRGQVYSLFNPEGPRPLKVRETPTHYKYVHVGHNGKRFVHHLVLETFKELPEELVGTDWEHDHIDGDKNNNFAENLQYLSAKANREKGMKNKRKSSGPIKIIDQDTGIVYSSINSFAKEVGVRQFSAQTALYNGYPCKGHHIKVYDEHDQK